MNKTIESILATGAFFILIRLCMFEATFDTAFGEILFHLALVVVSMGFGVFYDKVKPFEWQEEDCGYCGTANDPNVICTDCFNNIGK
ncbi:hypothetical protein JMA_41050 (plasmid) [Jeotgalibacillus malaysiensis]|uniref:Uncharacterized protein n=1 Tax=Jeotgalibacillus malaysiensis TaxID=1508404 RepID=A0A0B5AY21_9BACL|nr:hypothetical protein [Jeotgalibacillus malaysiensis]AJD93423.1 hypothetical protein JMA_41050 [Jeotgalibacillus malaysiensis]